MIRRLISALALSLIVLTSFAQDTLTTKKKKYFGIQANQLLRQIVNFSSSNAAVNNPYLLTYTVNNPSTGWGLNLGWGFNYNQISDGDAFTRRKTTVSDLAFRIGFERKRSFGKHWILASGMDLVVDSQSNKTTTSNANGGADVETKNTTRGFGLGPRLALYYDISGKILVGTEMTYYFKALNTKTTVSGGFQQPDVDESLNRFQLNLPAALFLVLRF